MTTAGWICLAIGLILCGFSGWQLAGRGRNARAWLGSPGLRVVSNTLFPWPSIGVALACFGLFGAVRDLNWLAIPISFLSIVAVLVLFGWGIFALPYPSALVPLWARGEVKSRKQSYKSVHRN